LKEFDPSDVNHVFAAFSVRIGLKIAAEGEASEHLARNAVQSHMRILIGAHDQVVITVRPSEPMLAIAAADALNDFLDVYKAAMTTLVNRLILRGLVLVQGIKGELCTQLLFTLARDRAVKPIVLSPMMTDLPDKVQAVSLSQFLKTLLGDDLGTSHQLSLHPNFLPRLSNIWINFTHFVQLSAPVTELEPAFLLEAWSSGIAFQCAPFQPVIDGFFVCYDGALDGAFNIRKLTVVPWQTKAKSKAAASTLVSQLTAPSILVVDNGQIVRRKTHPLVIFMDLGTSSSLLGTDRYVDLTSDTPTVPTKRGTWEGYARHNEQEPERYCLHICGHTSSTYDIMKHFDSQLGPLFCRSFVCTTPEFKEYLALMQQAMQRVTIKEE
jgi:hypothetical protein